MTIESFKDTRQNKKQWLIVAVIIAIWLFFAHFFYPSGKVTSTVTYIQQLFDQIKLALFYQGEFVSQPGFIDRLIILSGVFIQILVAAFLAFKISHWVFTLRFLRLEKWINQINEKKEELYYIFRPEESKKTEQRWPKDEIKHFLSEKVRLEKLERDKIEEAPRLIDELDTLIEEVKEKKVDIRWHDAAKLFYKVKTLCNELNNHDLANRVNKPYSLVREIIKSECIYNIISVFIYMGLFALFFGIFIWLSAWILGSNIVLGWFFSVLVIVLGILVSSFVYFGFQFYIKMLTEKTWTDLDDIIASILAAPLSAIIFGWATYKSFKALPDYFKNDIHSLWSLITQDNITQDNTVISIFVIIIVAWIAVFFFDRIIIYVLKRWAEKTEQKYDDMFVRILQVYGEFLIIAAAIAIILVKFQKGIKEATGVDNILLPYSILVSVFTAILGYASRESLENFFSGVLLQIDKPFEKGDRLVLETGEICEVQGIGMRSTNLYNVLENTLISIPNSVMVSEKITNTSKPDWELRVPIKVGIPNDGYSIWSAEKILIDIAYLDGEIDQARITEKELTPELIQRKREPITEKLVSLVKIYPHIKKSAISQIIGGGTARRDWIFAPDPEGGAKQFRQNKKTELNLWIAKNLFKKLTLETEFDEGDNKQIDNMLSDLNEGEGKIFTSLKHITKLRTKYAEQLDDTRKEISKVLPNKTNLEASFTDTQLQRLIEDVVYRVRSHKKSGKVFTGETLDYILLELAQREFIFLEKNVENTKERTTKNVEFIKQSLNGLAKQIASQRKEKDPKDSLKAIELIEEHLKYKELVRIGLLATIQEELAWVADALFTIGDTHRKDVRKEMDVLVAELGKEPTIHSQFVVTDNGRSYVAIDFNVYATHLERRFEVINKLNREIQRRFSAAEIEMFDTGSEAFLPSKLKDKS